MRMYSTNEKHKRKGKERFVHGGDCDVAQALVAGAVQS